MPGGGTVMRLFHCKKFSMLMMFVTFFRVYPLLGFTSFPWLLLWEENMSKVLLEHHHF